MHEHEITQDGIAYVPCRVAAKRVGLSGDYIARFCRENLVQAVRYASAWYVNEASLDAYLADQERQREEYRRKLSDEAKREADAAKARESAKHEPDISVAHMLEPYPPLKKRSRTIAEILLATLTLLAVTASGALAFQNIAPEKFANTINRVAATSQLAATSLPWLDEFASNIYRTVCPYFSDCKEFAQATSEKHQATKSAEVKSIPSKSFPAQGATTTAGVVSQKSATPTTKPATLEAERSLTVVNHPVVERIRETVRTVVEPGVNASYVDERLSLLESNLLNKISGVSSSASNSITQVYTTVGQMGRIEHLDELDLTDPTISNAAITGGTISSLSSPLAIGSGGTGTSSAPTYGKVLLGNTSGTYDLTATSSLGLPTFADVTSSVSSASFGKSWEISSGALSPTTTIGIVVSASSTFSGGIAASNATATNATSTNFFATLGRFTTGIIDTLTAAAATITNLTSTTIVATNATSSSLFAGDLAASTARFGGTATSTFTSAGRLGIGTTNPGSLLEVAGASTDTTTIDLDSGGHAYLQIDSGANTNESLVRFMDGGSTRFTMGLDNDSSHTVFSIGDNALSNKWLSIDNTGNVGIGDSTPTYKLDVTGVGRFTGLVDAASFTATSSSATSTFAGGLAVETSGLVYDYSTNNVGIGTAAPARKLTVFSDSTAGAGQLRLGFSDSFYWELGRDNGFDGRLMFLENGTERVTIDNGGGGFGIASSTPWAKLSVTNTGSGPSFVVEDSTSPDSSPFIIDASGAVGIGKSPASGYKLEVKGAGNTNTSYAALFSNSDDTSLLAIDNSGNVGIGTVSPATLLQLSGGSSNPAVLSVNAAAGQDTAFRLDTALTEKFKLGLAAGTDSGVTGTTLGDTFLRSAADIFFSANAGTTGHLTILNSGNVGIGTTTPATKLDVVSGLSVTDLYSSTARFVNSGNARVGIISGTAAEAILDFGDSANTVVGSIVYNNSEDYLKLHTAGTERVRILSSGNVGIGTTTPGAKLTVQRDSSPSGTTVHGNASAFLDAGGSHYLQFGAPTNSVAGVLFGDSGNNAIGSIIYSNANDTLTFAANPGLVVTQTSTGFGVGSTTPWRALSITGTVGFDGLTGSTGAGSLCLDSNKQVVYNSASDNCLSSTRATKHDITPLSLDDLQIVDALQPVSFVYNQGDGRVRYGFIAEDTANVDAHLATYDAAGTVSGIDDRSILAILVGAIKDLYARVQDYFARTEQLEERVGELEAQLAQLRGEAAAGAATTGESVGAPGGFPAPGETGADRATTTPPAENGTSGEPPTPATSTPEKASASADASTSEGATDVPEAPELEVAQEPPMAEPANDNEVPEPLPATGTE